MHILHHMLYDIHDDMNDVSSQPNSSLIQRFLYVFNQYTHRALVSHHGMHRMWNLNIPHVVLLLDYWLVLEVTVFGVFVPHSFIP